MGKMSLKHVFCAALFILLVFCLRESRGCFVTNCPLGGKRSHSRPYRQCLPCGPRQSGRCIGPGICCGSSFGCLINTKETITCRRENDLPTPCEVVGERCITVTGGKCTAFGVCCNDRGCVLDDNCKYSPSRFRNEQLLLPSSNEELYEPGGIGDRFTDFLFEESEK